MSEIKQKERIFIVGGGPTIKQCDLSRLEHEATACVNVSVFDVPNPDYFVTMDHSLLRKLSVRGLRLAGNTSTTRVFVAAMHHDYLVEKNGCFVDMRWRKVYQLNDFDVVIKARAVDGCGMTFRTFCSGNNSGYCAVQLAVLLNYKRICLVGMDLTTTDATHYHDLYPKQKSFREKLRSYAHSFRLGVRDILEKTDIEVVSCSPICPLNDMIPYIPFEKELG